MKAISAPRTGPVLDGRVSLSKRRNRLEMIDSMALPPVDVYRNLV